MSGVLRRFAAWLVVAGLAAPTFAVAQSAVSPAEQLPAEAAAGVSAADPLERLIDDAIASSARRYLDADRHTPWQIMHGLLALRGDYQIRKAGQNVNALEWLASGPRFDGRPWFEKTESGGRAHPYTRNYAFEGHPNQFLAILSMSDLPLDFRLRTPDGEITIADMVRHAQWEASTRDEPTWTLWALSHYLPPGTTWENKYDQRWSLESLVRLQVNETFERAACGGTHAGFALARALDKHRQTGRPPSGVWIDADQKVRRYLETARAYQNSDGTFSTSYFQSRTSSSDFATRLQTSGHTLEFVVAALPAERLREDWVRRAVERLAREIYDRRREAVDVGALFHAVDGLVIYRERTRAAAVDGERIARDSGAPSADAPEEDVEAAPPTGP
ncbi:MAG TPA: hypothetical protein VML55_04830 [Planctomycetaceae bacterium]|nr:hypothetical protein [Planctomycetaceae bacterium]